MSQIRRPAVHLPTAPREYSQREEQEFRRVLERILSESVEDATRPEATASFTCGTQTGSDPLDRYYYTWIVSGHPSGTTYNLLYKYTNTAGTLVEEGTVTGATSGGYIQSSGNIGASPTVTMTVTAMKDGQVVGVASRASAVLT